MVASGGVCKTLWLKKAIKLLMWVILKKIAFRFYLLDSLFSNFNSASTSGWFCTAISTVGECSVIVIIANAVILLSSSLSDSLAWCINRLSGING